LIGGDYQGQNPSIKNANITYVGRDSQLYADALISGDGGNIIHWADDSTYFYGSAFSRGGADSGDGGLVEVSGKIYLEYKGSVNTTARQGETGMLLLDPTDITIRNGSGDAASDGDTLDDGFNGCPTTTSACFSNGVYGQVLSNYLGPTEIYESELEGIVATTNIRLEATNDITIENLDDNVLELQTGNGNFVTFTADADNDGSGSFTMNDIADTIRTQGGEININGASIMAGNIDTTGANNNNGGDITVGATNGSVTVGTLISSGGATTGNDGNNAGDILLRTGNTNNVSDSITINGNITANGSDAIGANIGGIPEMLDHNNTGLIFESGNINDLTENILKISSYSNEQVSSLGKNARNHVANTFTSQRYYNDMLNLYSSLGVRTI